MRRHELSDEDWSRVEKLLPAEKGRPGRPSGLSNRMFMNAIFYIAKTGAPWRDLPERFGPWQTVHTRFTRWNRQGVFDLYRHGWGLLEWTGLGQPIEDRGNGVLCVSFYCVAASFLPVRVAVGLDDQCSITKLPLIRRRWSKQIVVSTAVTAL